MEGRYDGYMGRVYVFNNLLKDGKTYVIMPSHDYIKSQSAIVCKMALEFHGGDLERAIDDYVQNHAKHFSQIWEEHPEKREDMVEYYLEECVK